MLIIVFTFQFFSERKNLVSLILKFDRRSRESLESSREKMKHIVPCLENIHNLSIIDYQPHMYEILHDLSTSCKNLRTLSLDGEWKCKIFISQLLKQIGFFFTGCSFSSSGINAILKKSKVANLTIEECNVLLDEQTSSLTNLQCLRLKSYLYSIGEDALKKFLTFKNLKEIHLIGLHLLTDDVLNELCMSCKTL